MLLISITLSLSCSCCGSGCRLCPKTPAPLKGLQGFLEVKQLERRFKTWGFLWNSSSFAVLSGKALLVHFWVWSLELRRRTHVVLLKSKLDLWATSAPPKKSNNIYTCLSLFFLSLAGSSLSAIRPSSSSGRGVWVPMTFCSSDSNLRICLQNAGDELKSVSDPAYLIWRRKLKKLN